MLIIVCLTIYLSYVLIENRFAFSILIIISYILLSKVVKYSYFKESSLEVLFPLKLFSKRLKINYEDIETIERGAGSYLDGSILVIRYFRKNTSNKMVIDMISLDEWDSLKERLINYGIKLKSR